MRRTGLPGHLRPVQRGIRLDRQRDGTALRLRWAACGYDESNGEPNYFFHECAQPESDWTALNKSFGASYQRPFYRAIILAVRLPDDDSIVSTQSHRIRDPVIIACTFLLGHALLDTYGITCSDKVIFGAINHSKQHTLKFPHRYT